MSEYLGKTVGEFQLVETIDESGSAMVFKGFQPGMNRYVAIKMLKPSTVRDPGAVQLFLQQGELMAQMQHPNILTIYASGQADGMVYRATRLAESGSLRDHLNWFYNPTQALGLMEDLVNALESIYSQGHVHGNLKPTNVLLDATQKPLLTDFGLPPRLGQTQTPYLAPEQVQGGVVDARVDVFALGVLLFEMLTGQAPPSGAVVSPRSLRPDLPEAIERVILRAMAQNSDQRFQTVREMQNALKAALVPAAPSQPAYQPIYTPMPELSQNVTVESQKSGPNWMAIILGVLLVGALCLGATLVLPRLLETKETQVAELPPTQPPPDVTVIVPTVVLPTREPRPSQPLEEPTQEPPAEEPPAQLPDEPVEPPDGGLPAICGSVGLAVGGVGLVGATKYKRRRL